MSIILPNPDVEIIDRGEFLIRDEESFFKLGSSNTSVYLIFTRKGYISKGKYDSEPLQISWEEVKKNFSDAPCVFFASSQGKGVLWHFSGIK